jgi:hypothetical protein
MGRYPISGNEMGTQGMDRNRMIVTRRPYSTRTVIFSIAVTVLCTIGLLFFSGAVTAKPDAPQMMGGGGMRGMMHGMLADNVLPGVKPRDLPAPNSEGARLTARYCMECHRLASPSMHTASEWRTVADRMFRRMAAASQRGMMRMSVSVPSTRQKRLIVDYLQAYALRSISPGALGSPTSPGASAFRNSCSECHALPDPKLHGARDWPAIVRKMQSYAKQLGKKRITSRQAREVERFLERRAGS